MRETYTSGGQRETYTSGGQRETYTSDVKIARSYTYISNRTVGLFTKSHDRTFYEIARSDFLRHRTVGSRQRIHTITHKSIAVNILFGARNLLAHIDVEIARSYRYISNRTVGLFTKSHDRTFYDIARSALGEEFTPSLTCPLRRDDILFGAPGFYLHIDVKITRSYTYFSNAQSDFPRWHGRCPKYARSISETARSISETAGL